MTSRLKRGKYVLIFALMLISSAAFSQVNEYTFGIGGGVGLNRAFADVEEYEFSKSYYVKGFYYFTPYITGDVEAQTGNIRGGNVVTNTHKREYNNRYLQITANGKIFAGKFINNFGALAFLIRGLNLGIGAGFIFNKMTYIVRVKPDGSNYIFPGKDKSVNFTVPINLGYDIHLYSVEEDARVVLGLNLQHNVTFGEGLDGYDDPNKSFHNSAPDMFTVLSVGVKYNFGGSGLPSRRRR